MFIYTVILGNFASRSNIIMQSKGDRILLEWFCHSAANQNQFNSKKLIQSTTIFNIVVMEKL